MPPRVVVVGSINVDLVVRVPRLPRPGETVTDGVFARAPGGKGGNQATAAARLGARVALLGAVGDDEDGAGALEDLRRAEVDVDRVRVVAGVPTGVAQVCVDIAGENQIAVAPGANREVTPEEAEAGIEVLVGEGDVVVAALELEAATVAAAAAAAVRRGGRVVLNPAPARVLPASLLADVAVLTPNEHEVSHIVPGAARPDEIPVPALVETRGAAGCVLFRPGRPPHRQAAFPVRVVDTTGAGDAFTAALAWALADGRDLEDAVRLAAAAGALATRAGGARAGHATAAEVEALAAER